MKEATFPIFSMVNDFESKSFHIPEIKANHRSLYYFLLGLVLHNRGANRLEVAYDYGMRGSKIGNHGTYTDALRLLQEHKFITYTPGKNRYCYPIIEVHFCKPTDNLLRIYRESIGVSTANNIKAIDTKEAIDTPAPPAAPKGTNKDDVFLKFFNEHTGRNFRTLDAKAKRQIEKLKKDGYKYPEFTTALKNGFEDSKGWPNPSQFTPEYFTRETNFIKYLNWQPKPTSHYGNEPKPYSPATKAEQDALWGEVNTDFKPKAA